MSRVEPTPDLHEIEGHTQKRGDYIDTAEESCEAAGQEHSYVPVAEEMPLVRALPQVKNLLQIPEFWNKYDSEQVAEISRENARQIAENDSNIAERLLYNIDKEIKHMSFIYDSLQESIWNLDLKYLNAWKANAIIKKRHTSKKTTRRAKTVLREVERKRSEMVEQKISILQTMADAPWDIADYLRAHPTVTDVDIF